MEDLRAQIRTRGLSVGGGPNTPLRDFWGTFDGYDPVHNAQFNSLNVKLKFSDIEVLESLTPYDFPAAELTIKFSDRADGSLWGIFSGSVNKHLAETEDLPALIGKRVHLKYTPGHMMFNRSLNNGTGGQEAREAWEMIGVEGAAGSNGAGAAAAALSPDAAILIILEGKTEQEFNAAALRDNRVKADAGMVGKILNRSLIGELVTNGSATLVEGRYRVNPDLLAALTS
jgi:hypothetical protein